MPIIIYEKDRISRDHRKKIKRSQKKVTQEFKESMLGWGGNNFLMRF